MFRLFAISALVVAAVVIGAATVAYLWPATIGLMILLGVAILFGMLVFSMFHNPIKQPTREEYIKLFISLGYTPQEAKELVDVA